MKLFPGCFLAVSFACAYFSTFAQTTSSAMDGKVFTVKGQPVDSATIVLMRSRDSSVVRSTISSKAGIFNFDHIEAGSYLVFITKLSYNKVYSGPYHVIEGKTLSVDIFTLEPAVTQLKEVAITGKKDFVEVRADKTVLNVDKNIRAAGSSIYDVLTASPGVKVTGDEILYRGGQKALIAINGKPVLLSGDELINLLKNYQSSSISQIELIENPGGKYDASASGGVINIILKKNKELGSKVTLTESAAYGDKYKINSGIIYNLRTEKLNLFASYGFQDSKLPHTIYNDRNIFTDGQLYNFNLNYNANIKSVNNNFTVGADYDFTKGQTISFLINGFDNNLTYNKLNTTIISTNGQRDSTINTHSTINRDLYNISYDLTYKANLDKSGNSVLSADGDYTNYHRSSDEFLQNNFINPNGQTDGILFYHDSSPSHITISSINIDFTQALSKSSHLGAGIKTSKVSSDNQIDFEQQTNNGYKPDSSLTDHFMYNERINAAYLTFDGKFNNTSLSVGLRGEQTRSTAQSASLDRPVDSSYFNLFPTIQISQDLSKNNKLTFRYSGNIRRPDYQDLNPFVGYVDQFYYSTGNPYLKPSYINTYEVSDFLMNKYKISFAAVITDNYFNTVFQQDDATKVYTSIKENLGTRYQYLLKFYVPVDITNWWNINGEFDAYYENYVYNSYSRARKAKGISIYLNQAFKLTPKLSAQLYDSFESGTYYIISQYKPQFYMDAGLNYSILENKGSISLAASDIFNTFYNKYHTNFNNLDITAKDKYGSRFVTATFTYRFGNSSARNRNKSSNEQKRLGGSSNEN